MPVHRCLLLCLENKGGAATLHLVPSSQSSVGSLRVSETREVSASLDEPTSQVKHRVSTFKGSARSTGKQDQTACSKAALQAFPTC